MENPIPLDFSSKWTLWEFFSQGKTREDYESLANKLFTVKNFEELLANLNGIPHLKPSKLFGNFDKQEVKKFKIFLL